MMGKMRKKKNSNNSKKHKQKTVTRKMNLVQKSN